MKANTGRSYRLYPDVEAASLSRQYGGACRAIYNAALEQRESAYKSFGQTKVREAMQMRDLTVAREALPWLKAVPVHALQQALRHADRAFQNWWANREHFARPAYKSRKDGVRFSYADPKDWSVRKVRGRLWEIRLPKIGWVRFLKHRPFGGEIRNVTVSESAGRWTVSFGVAERKCGARTKPHAGVIGVDRGVTNTIATSRPVAGSRLHSMPELLTADERRHLLALERRSGTQLEALKRRRAKAKREHRERPEVSNAHRATFAAIAVIQARKARRRNDWLRKMAALLGEFEVVAFEDLKIKNMTKTASGTVETPGTRVAQKRGLNRAILNAGWGNLALYTAERTRTVKVYAPGTSQLCAECAEHGIKQYGVRSGEHFWCEDHGPKHADLNASENIEARGTRVLAEDSQPRTVGSHSRKAAPTKNRKALNALAA